jgi:prevent-host-death family protein
MFSASVHEAKTHLSRLLERARAGEEVIITKNGKPVAKLVPIGRGVRKFGRLKGRIKVGTDFDEPLPEEVLSGFEGQGD